MADGHEFAAPAQLDQVTMSVEFLRAVPGVPTTIRMTGLSHKRSHPLWTWYVTEEDPRNLASVIGGVMGSVEYYRPTTPDAFLRACVGGSVDVEDPTLF